jgi:hypothetical protein
METMSRLASTHSRLRPPHRLDASAEMLVYWHRIPLWQRQTESVEFTVTVTSSCAILFVPFSRDPFPR